MEKRGQGWDQMGAFVQHLHMEERERGTIEKYLCDLQLFMAWAGERKMDKPLTFTWKEHLKAQGYKPETINGKLSALNKYLCFIGREECRVKLVHIQRRLFRGIGRELTKKEYLRLVDTAQSLGKRRLALLMEAICATGIRSAR